jgi:hypothetical protein
MEAPGGGQCPSLFRARRRRGREPAGELDRVEGLPLDAPKAATLITMNEPSGPPRVSRFFYPVDIIREKLMDSQSTAVTTFCEEFADFAALARGESGIGRLATGIDGLRAIETAHVVYESGRIGKAVMLPPFD